MAILNVQANGNAPANAKIGDTVRTAAGNYTIVPNGTVGATYNPKSGFWSVKSDTSNVFSSAESITSMNNQMFKDNVARANAISADSSAKQYEFNSKEAEKNRNWQEMMSNTSHQREVQDLIKAGLNPVLSALNGASTPSGATASGGSYSGQSAPVDTSLLSALFGLYGVMLNNQTSKDIAKINAETALQTSKINSAASVYSADRHASSKSPLNNFGNYLLANNSAKVSSWIDNLSNDISNSIWGREWRAFTKDLKDTFK